MTNPKEELEHALKQFRELDAEYKQELQQAQAARDLGLERRRKNRGNWKEILASTGVDLEKIREYEKAAAQRAEEIHNDVIRRLSPVPAAVLSRAQDSIKVNQVGGLKSSDSNWWTMQLPPLSFATPTGNCGSVSVGLNAGMLWPKAEAKGKGSGWDGDDSPYDEAQCGWWYVLPTQNLPTNALTPIFVWPFLDMHGFIHAKAEDDWWTSKHAKAIFTISIRISQFGASVWSNWEVRHLEFANDDQEGRLDKTAYDARASAHRAVLGGEPVQIEILVDAVCNAQGSGSYALIDFQSGQNYFYIPWVLVSIPIP
jgi:hypothetical protein